MNDSKKGKKLIFGFILFVCFIVFLEWREQKKLAANGGYNTFVYGIVENKKKHSGRRKYLIKYYFIYNNDKYIDSEYDVGCFSSLDVGKKVKIELNDKFPKFNRVSCSKEK